ncbi:hypothetical protein [Burkholderia ubonensis]|uniref:hypothetical protein n=1 Tax=Burkholderia ubonensis TaxID=101571 RepID=UPI000AE93EA4|nr:hypothetical protein [Burkholderia ubonensis]
MLAKVLLKIWRLSALLSVSITLTFSQFGFAQQIKSIVISQSDIEGDGALALRGTVLQLDQTSERAPPPFTTWTADCRPASPAEVAACRRACVGPGLPVGFCLSNCSHLQDCNKTNICQTLPVTPTSFLEFGTLKSLQKTCATPKDACPPCAQATTGQLMGNSVTDIDLSDYLPWPLVQVGDWSYVLNKIRVEYNAAHNAMFELLANPPQPPVFATAPVLHLHLEPTASRPTLHSIADPGDITITNAKIDLYALPVINGKHLALEFKPDFNSNVDPIVFDGAVNGMIKNKLQSFLSDPRLRDPINATFESYVLNKISMDSKHRGISEKVARWKDVSLESDGMHVSWVPACGDDGTHCTCTPPEGSSLCDQVANGPVCSCSGACHQNACGMWCGVCGGSRVCSPGGCRPMVPSH